MSIEDVEAARIDALAQLPDEAFMAEVETVAMALKRGENGAKEKMMRLAKSQGEHMAKHISAEMPGISKLLNRRRLAYSMVDGIFRSEAVFERIFVFQVPRVVGDTFEDSVLVKSEVTQQREEEENPCGVIVSAGLKGLDILHSNGMDVGHLVEFARLSPTRKVVDVIRGQEIYVLVLRAGDLIGSLDLPYFRSKGKVATKAFMTSGGVQHRLVDPSAPDESASLAPALPWISRDV